MNNLATNKQNLFSDLVSLENLELAYRKARKHKTLKQYVVLFEKELQKNLLQLQRELVAFTYKPLPLVTFVLRDPKTRKISKSDFRDRVIHHAVCNIIEHLFEKTFIYDSYANRIGKGALKAIKRFESFQRIHSGNNTKTAYILKADIQHYFDTVKHDILLAVLARKISDKRVLWLIRVILNNHHTTEIGRGMPLGNLTSQFFANVYLNELDQFVKHSLHAKHYIRYVDDFVIFHNSPKILELYKESIDHFLKTRLDLHLHPDKSKIIPMHQGVSFLGFTIYPHHKRIKKKNIIKFERKLASLAKTQTKNLSCRDKAVESFQGWIAYANHANMYKYKRSLTKKFNILFPLQPSRVVPNAKKHERQIHQTEVANQQFSAQKTLLLYRKGFSIQQIAEKRELKTATIWEHIARLIEHHQLSLWKIVPKEKINQILPRIYSIRDKLKSIKEKIANKEITYDEINCVLAYVKSKHAKNSLAYLCKRYQKKHCYRKCFFNQEQRKKCKNQFNQLIQGTPLLKMNEKDFLYLFNNHIFICVLPPYEKNGYITWQEFKTKLKKISEEK